MNPGELPPPRYRPPALRDYQRRIAELITNHAPSSLADSLAAELENQAFLAMFAALEGLLRVDLERRIANGFRQDALTLELQRVKRNASHSKSGHVRLESILEAWKFATQQGREIGRFADFVRLRDWLAHGRVGKKPPHVRPNAQRLYDLALHISNKVKGWPRPDL